MASRHSGRAINFYFLFLVVHKEDDSQNRKKFQVSTGRRIVIGYFTFKWGFEDSKKKGGECVNDSSFGWPSGFMIFSIWFDFYGPHFFLYHAGIHLLFSLQKKDKHPRPFSERSGTTPPPPQHTHTHKRVVVRFTIDSIFFRHPCQQQSSQAT